MKKRLLALLLCICMLLCIPQAGASVTRLGDADCDGAVTAADASLILRYTVHLSEMSEQGCENADVYPDGSVNSIDATYVLRYIIGLTDLVFESPDPSATLPTQPTPTATATATASATATPELDETLLKLVRKGCQKGSNQYHDWTVYAEAITLFIQTLPTSNPYREILYRGATHMGTSYGTGSGQLDCSGFVRTVYREDCGYKKEYPTGGSDTVIQWFIQNQPKRIHNAVVSDDYIDTTGWKPGYVLAYTDSTGKGNHVSIYLGCVDGVEFVMESATKAGGVCIRRLWSNETWRLKYYINPLD